jgi:hypothetical protein
MTALTAIMKALLKSRMENTSRRTLRLDTSFVFIVWEFVLFEWTFDRTFADSAAYGTL